MQEPPPPELPTVLATRTELHTSVWDVVRATLRNADGREFERYVVEHPGAVAIVALDGEGRWLLVRQYRHPARRSLLEIPAGTREPGEEPDVTAHRELREETGYAAGSLVRLGGAWMAPGFTSEYIHFYLATSLRYAPLPADDDEGLSAPIPLTPGEVLAAVDSGEIDDAKTLAALALLERARRLGLVPG